MKAETKVERAKVQLLLNQPFFGSLLLNLKFTFTKEVPTAAVSIRELQINTDFIDMLGPDETIFLLAHEAMHLMLKHTFRMKNREHLSWNVATDIVINYLLIQEKIGKFPKCGIHMPTIYEECNGLEERIYEHLVKNRHLCSEQMDEIVEAEGTVSELEEAKQLMETMVAQAAQTARAMGKLSKSMERFVNSILVKKVKYEDVIRQYIIKQQTSERTFSRLNRRFINQGLYLPTQTGESLGHIVTGIDCSGSVGEKELNLYLGHMQRLKEDFDPEKMSIIYFDHNVTKVDIFDRETDISIKGLPGGGGTDYIPVFDYIETEGIDVSLCIMVTDLMCDSFGDAPNYPVLWLTDNQAESVPFGDKIYL